MRTSTHFDRFLRNITLTADERADATSRSNVVAKKLHGHYYPTTSYTGSTKLLIGSHGKRTRVRPVRDVDLIFRIPGSTFRRFDDYSGNGQSALLQEIRGLLLARYPSTKVKGDGPVVVVPFTSGHTVEVLPAYYADDRDTYWIPNTREGGSWMPSNYSAEFNYLDDSDRATNGQTRRLIKMMKVWQQHCNVPVKSLCIELRAINFLSTWEHRGKASMWDDWMVRDYLAELIRYANGSCKIPGISEKCEYGDAWVSKAKTALRNAEEACNYEGNDGDEAVAVYMWTKIFGDQYDE